MKRDMKRKLTGRELEIWLELFKAILSSGEEVFTAESRADDALLTYFKKAV